jgi:hypothetical protein
MTTQTFTLSQPLKTHDGEVTELKLKAPRAGLLIKYDDPFEVKWNKDDNRFDYIFDNKSMMRFASEMTGVDDLILEDLSVRDFWKLRYEIAGIILETVPDKNPS